MSEASAEPESLRPVLLDSCVVLNLFATGQMKDILWALQRPVSVSEYTREREALWVGSGRRGDQASDNEPVLLDPLIGDGTLSVVRPEGDIEAGWVVAMAAHLDDGEAVVAAIAIVRGMVIATDDRKAITVMNSLRPAPELISTSAIIRAWQTRNSVPRQGLRDVLRAIRDRARFVPNGKDPLHRWWMEATE